LYFLPDSFRPHQLIVEETLLNVPLLDENDFPQGVPKHYSRAGDLHTY